MKFLKITSVLFFVMVSSALIYFKHIEANTGDPLEALEKNGEAQKSELSIFLIVSGSEVYSLTKSDFEKLKSYKKKLIETPFIASSKAMPVEIILKNPVSVTIIYNSLMQKYEIEKPDLDNFTKFLKKK